MKRIGISILAGLVLATWDVVVMGSPAQTPVAPQASTASSPAQDRVIGEVRNIDLPNNKLAVRTDTGSTITILLSEKIVCLRALPGEANLEHAQKIALSEILQGDRIYARGKLSQDKKAITASQLVMMPKGEILKKQERDREEWVKRGISGVVSAINPQAKEITIQFRGPEGPKPMIVTATQGLRYRRYAPGSVKFADAKPSSLEEVKIGDQIRALGEKSRDSKRLAAEEIVSGSFRTVGGTVTEVIPQRREIKLALLNKQEVTVAITRDTMIRRITPQLAASIAGLPSGPPDKSSAGKQSEGPVDLQSLLEKMPPMPPQEIRPGDSVVISSTQGSDPTRLTAIVYLTGLDVLLSVLQGKKPPKDAGPRNLDTGLPMGVLEFGIGLP